MHSNSSNKAKYIALAVVGLVFIIALVGWFVLGSSRNSARKPLIVDHSTSTISQAPHSSHKLPPNPYSGWKSAYLSNEKLTYKYPPNWTPTNGVTINAATNSGNSDQVTLTSPTNLLVTIQTGISNPQSLNNIIDAVPISTLGSNNYLDFYNNFTAITGLAQGACVLNAPAAGADYPQSNNISLSSGATAMNKICITYPQDEDGKVFQNTVSAFKSDPSYKDAFLIISSLTY